MNTPPTRCEALRSALNLPQWRFADLLRVRQSAVSRWEAGRELTGPVDLALDALALAHGHPELTAAAWAAAHVAAAAA